ncbi:hypothetical protein ACG7TL_004271 [Trametes sanguinea]
MGRLAYPFRPSQVEQQPLKLVSVTCSPFSSMTTVTEGGYVYVDDSDPKVVYSGDWGISNTEYAWHETLHFASEEGSTASLKFTGTWISVVGGGGDTNQFGYPSTSYVIDGKNYKTLQTSADASHDTYFDNVTMFTSPTLDAGEHTLVITNLNGTKPNTFWLDYFWILIHAWNDVADIEDTGHVTFYDHILFYGNHVVLDVYW